MVTLIVPWSGTVCRHTVRVKKLGYDTGMAVLSISFEGGLHKNLTEGFMVVGVTAVPNYMRNDAVIFQKDRNVSWTSIYFGKPKIRTTYIKANCG